MDGLIGFMTAPLGRGLRVILGLGGAWGTVLAIVGLVPIAMGVWGRGRIAPLAGGGRAG